MAACRHHIMCRTSFTLITSYERRSILRGELTAKPISLTRVHRQLPPYRTFAAQHWRPSVHQEERNSSGGSNLYRRTHKWLHLAVGSWTARNVSEGQNLIDHWLLVDNVPYATRVMQRWIQERASGNPQARGQFVVELLHRVLDAWKVACVNDKHSRNAVRQTALQLFGDLVNACRGDDLHKPGNKAYSMIFQILALQVNANTSDQILKMAQELLERCLENETPDLQLWHTCLHVMSKCSKFSPTAPELAESTLQRMVKPAPNVFCIASVIHAWAKSGRGVAGAARANAIFEQLLLPDSPVKPNNVCINMVVDAWAECGEAEQAEKLVRRMEELSRQPGNEHLKPDSITYSTIVHAWARSSDVQAAWHAERIFNYMQRLYEEGNESISPDESTCGSVLNAWSKSHEPGAAQRAEQLLNRMEELYNQGKSSVRPSVVMYACVINAWANSPDDGAAENAERILGGIEWRSRTGRKDVTPGTIAYTAAIHAWSKSPDKTAPDHALALLRQMQDMRDAGRALVAPNSITFNTVLAACARHGQGALAARLLEEMHLRTEAGEIGVEPNTVSYCTVIDAYRKEGAPENALNMLDEMESLYHNGNSNVAPNAVAYSTAILAWRDQRDTNAGDKADAIFRRMISQLEAGNTDAKPNAVTLAAVMCVWASAGEAQAPERIGSLLEWMKNHDDDSLKPNRIHYNHLIQSWAQSRRVDSVQYTRGLLNEMRESPRVESHPDCRSCNLLMLAIRNSSDPNRAGQCFEVLEEMLDGYNNGNASMQPTMWSFHLVWTACVRDATDANEEQDQATVANVLRQTFHAFTSGEWHPTPSTYKLLLKSCDALGDSIDRDLLEQVREYCVTQRELERGLRYKVIGSRIIIDRQPLNGNGNN